MYETRRMLFCHGPVAAFFLCYYLLTLRGMQIGGGPLATPADVLRRLISMGLGGPADGLLGWPAVAVAVGVIVWGYAVFGAARAMCGSSSRPPSSAGRRC